MVEIICIQMTPEDIASEEKQFPEDVRVKNLKLGDTVYSSDYGKGTVDHIFPCSHAGFNWGISFGNKKYEWYNTKKCALGSSKITLFFSEKAA